MFQPTHLLVSRSRQVPVRVVSQGETSKIYTEQEWGKTQEPAFELHSKLGMFCRGVQVLGYELEPMSQTADASAPKPTAARSA